MKRYWTVAVVLGVGAAVGGVAAYPALSDSHASSAPSGAAVGAAGAGPGRLARAFGFDTETATPVSHLMNGDTVRLLGDGEARCLVRTRQGQIVGEACASNADLATGRGITVTDECGSDSAHLMEITGLSPSGVTSVRLVRSDGSFELAPVESGTFKFEGTNPASGAAYPTSVEWLGGDTVVGRARIPVEGGEFCLPQE